MRVLDTYARTRATGRYARSGRAPIIHQSSIAEKNPRRARGAGRGRGGGVGTYQLRDVIVARGGERLRDLRGEGRAGWVSEPPGLAGKRGGWSFRPRRGDVERSYGHAPPPRRTPVALLGAFLRRSRSRRCLRSARRDSPASIGRRPSLGRRSARCLPSPRNSAHTRPTKRSNLESGPHFSYKKKKIIIFPRNSNSRLKQLALHPRGSSIKTRAGVGAEGTPARWRRRRRPFGGHQELLQPQRRAGAPNPVPRRPAILSKPRCPTSWTSRRPRPSPG